MDEKKNRQSWIDAGLDTLAQEGHEALRIMPIATKLGVTKGSFYWHFKNLDEYHEALLHYWEQGHTQQIIDAVNHKGGESAARLRGLFSSLPPGLLKLGRAMRAWSLNSERVALVQARVDQLRIDFVTRLLTDVGWTAEEAPFVAQWHYCALIGQGAINAPVLEPHQVDTLMRLLIKSPPLVGASSAARKHISA